MKIEKNEFMVEKSNVSNTLDFGIKNPEIIFDILCNRLYKNELKTAIQEYMCNAMDSHIEAGKNDLPITIVLPTIVEQTLQIIDYGVGISPDRMESVFVYLGESTKRSTDDLVGGFGLGAKIGFSYTDVFTIITIFNKIKYTYLAFIGDSGIGQCDLLSEEKTSEENGTTISLNIKKSDIKSTHQWVNYHSLFWDITPNIINNDHFESYNYKYNFIKIKNCDILDRTNANPYSFDQTVYVVYNGIIYDNIELSTIMSFDAFKNIKEKSYIFFVHCKTGEIDIAVNRESLQYTSKTINAIKFKLMEVINYININIDTISKQSDNVFDFYEKIKMYPYYKLINNYIVIYNNVEFIINNNILFDYSKYNLTLYELYINNDSFYSSIKRVRHIILSQKRIIFKDDTNKNLPRKQLKQFLMNNDMSNNFLLLSGDFLFDQTDNDPVTTEYNKNLLDFLMKNCILLSDIKKQYSGTKIFQKKISDKKYYTYSYSGQRHTFKLRHLLYHNVIYVYIPNSRQNSYINYLICNSNIQLYNKIKNTNYQLLILPKLSIDCISDNDNFINYNDISAEIISTVANNISVDIIGLNIPIFNWTEYNIIKSISNSVKDVTEIHDIKIQKLLKLINRYRNKHKFDIPHIPHNSMNEYQHAISMHVYKKMLRISKVLNKKHENKHQELCRYISSTYPLLNIIFKYDIHDNINSIVEYLNLMYDKQQ